MKLARIALTFAALLYASPVLAANSFWGGFAEGLAMTQQQRQWQQYQQQQQWQQQQQQDQQQLQQLRQQQFQNRVENHLSQLEWQHRLQRMR